MRQEAWPSEPEFRPNQYPLLFPDLSPQKGGELSIWDCFKFCLNTTTVSFGRAGSTRLVALCS